MDKFTLFFENFARRASALAGRPLTFMLACLLIVVWGLTGPLFGFSDTWQLVINTSTTIVTFLMVFLVQSAQNRDARALQLKLDELIFKMGKADNVMINIEDLSEKELMEINERYKRVRERHARSLKKRKTRPKSEDVISIAQDVKSEQQKESGRVNGKRKPVDA